MIRRNTLLIAATFFVSFGPISESARGVGQAKNQQTGQCDVEGAPVPCDWLEHCLLDGGTPEKIGGKGYCCYGDICEGVPEPVDVKPPTASTKLIPAKPMTERSPSTKSPKTTVQKTQTARVTPAAKAAAQSPRLPEGAFLEGKQVKLREGYTTRPLADGKVALMRPGGNAIEGTFECSCSGDGQGCALSTKGDVMFCHNQGDCRRCVLLVTISDKPNVIQ